jgi:DivIVA domain-containing protein
MRCLECGTEIAGRAQVCARCGSWAPVEYQLYAAEDRAADAACDAAGGRAPAAIHASAGQQRPESAPDPDLDGAVLAEWAETRAFSTTRLGPGYGINEVNDFLGAIRDTFLGIREPSLTQDEIRNKQFSTTRLLPGYDQEEVDAVLDEAESRLAAQVSARREAPAADPESAAADPAAGEVPIRCLECGAEGAEPAQACGRCETPVGQQRPGAAGAAGGSAGLIPPDHPSAGLRTRPGSRRNALVIAGAGLAVLTTVTVVSTLANSPTSSGSSPSTSQTSADELRTGDCLKGSDLDLGHSTPWPDHVTVVPCTQEHIAEVFFAGNSWPESQAYPGKNAIDSRADDRCNTAFTTYDGTTSDNSAFTYDIVVPDVSDDWASGDRSIACVAYESTSRKSSEIV